MNAQSIALVTIVLLLVLFWLLKNFVDKKISSGQALFWLFPLVVAQILALFPTLIDRVSAIWGNLVPVSWITFVGMVFLVFYLLYLTVRLNGYSRFIDLARNVAYLERRLRETEARCEELAEKLARAE
jgi:hypothetical protein